MSENPPELQSPAQHEGLKPLRHRDAPSTAELEARAALAQARTVVIKVGSSVLCADAATSRSVLHRVTLELLCDDVEALVRGGARVVVVSSGAIALGTREVGLDKRPADIASRQALAAIGQSSLMRAWRDALRERGLVAAQVLLTHADFADRRRYLAARRSMTAMLDYGAVPIVNENDTVADEEIRFGDNDRLSAQVAALLDADVLALLSTHDGLFDRNPDTDPCAEPLRWVPALDDAVAQMAQDGTSAWGTGGMASKIEAARAAAHFGVTALIAKGRDPGALRRALVGERVGTLFKPASSPISSRKHWIGYTLKPSGDVVVDAGAAAALRSQGRSLLPSGVRGVRGHFEVGDAVRVVSEQGAELGRGLSCYGSVDVVRIAGAKSERIGEILGYYYGDEVIHRDNLVLF